MHVRFISTLTLDDEGMFAPVVLKALSTLLEPLPIAYTLRVETSDGKVWQHSHLGDDTEPLQQTH